MHFYCPACNGRLLPTDRLVVIVLPVLRLFRSAYALCCQGCSLVTEVDLTTGGLVDLNGHTLNHLYAPYNVQEFKPTMRSLRPTRLYQGRES